MMYGMQSLSSDVPEVCVLSVSSCIATGSARRAASRLRRGGLICLHGMQGMRSDVRMRFSAAMSPALLDQP
jgi:hypothetical protein